MISEMQGTLLLLIIFANKTFVPARNEH